MKDGLDELIQVDRCAEHVLATHTGKDEQVIDQLFAHNPESTDPSLATVFARVKRAADVEHVRDAILQTIAEVRRFPVTTDRLDEAKSHARTGTPTFERLEDS